MANDLIVSDEPFAESWKRICLLVGRSERWCRYMARRTDDPLPVYKIGGITRLDRVDLIAWLDRQRERGVANPRPAVWNATVKRVAR